MEDHSTITCEMFGGWGVAKHPFREACYLRSISTFQLLPNMPVFPDVFQADIARTIGPPPIALTQRLML
jgi:hypothetical protein